MKKANGEAKNGNGSKMGRPRKYQEDYARQAKVACREGGFTNPKLAKLFNVDIATIKRWRNDFPDFCAALKKGKDDFNIARAEDSLIKRLLGYTYTETTRELVGDDLVVTKKVRKKIPAEPSCIMFFLKNRDHVRWRDIRAIELSGKDSKPIEHKHGLDDVARELLESVAGMTRGLPNRTENKIRE